MMPVFVDDGTLASNSEALLDKLVAGLAKYFKLRDLGSALLSLGIEIIQHCTQRRLELS